MTQEQKDKIIQFKSDAFEWFNKAIPIAMVSFLAWVLLTVVSIQRDIVVVQSEIVATKLKIVEVETHLQEHRSEMKEDRSWLAIIHHVENKQKCNSCHGRAK